MERIKVVLIDNDEDELFFMRQGFEASHRYEIMAQFSNGLDFDKFLHNSSELPDLIVTDLNMPGQSGVEIATDINSNSQFASIKVIVLSLTSGSDDFDLPIGLAGTALFLPKPKSPLEYKRFAINLHEKILGDLFKA